MEWSSVSTVLLFKLGHSAIVSLVLEQEAPEEHVCSQGFILGDIGARQAGDGQGLCRFDFMLSPSCRDALDITGGAS